MKAIIERANERGESNLGWLQSRFSFSFAEYYNPLKMGFGRLRVLNDDVIAKGHGFDTHPHANMEIITIPTYGKVAHKDSTGAKEEVGVGEIQVMSAGSGLSHSEYNYSKTDELRLFQIWIEPMKKNIKPRHEKKRFKILNNRLKLVVTDIDTSKKSNVLGINQNAKIYLGNFDEGIEFSYDLREKFGLFIMIIEGSAKIQDHILAKRDSICISEIKKVDFKLLQDTKILIIETPL